ncbi:Vancomycin resistance protein YoaR, contains peptidoglycan-binding and VanW domains [Sediminibacillus albus]|uniref:Vancomycin resistance protein YoaR, contains peptidoglycan-binding and VanW domains n=2 Tax=Sediminibacillus albus TaxID=407036 RepID=A0A1G8X6V5_9BACI|nr:VanW family protein [Sediminibacillus albus]SDJ86352.1 Vancomycin resistance protein YoaR, contains peptidoglycan-binding and VanW domains [Sediminibacillus albus]
MKILITALLLIIAPQQEEQKQIEQVQSQPFTIIYNGKSIQKVNRSDVKLPHLEEKWLDMDKFNRITEELAEKVYKEPVDAGIDDLGRIKPAKPGHQLDRQQFSELFAYYYYANQLNEVEAPLRVVHPRVDEELLASIREKPIGKYVTYYNSNNKERSQNIVLAAQAINNHVVFPRETFSFNGVVGKRTEEKGYQPAPVIVKGELAEDIGGGICQVSSTLYNAVDQAGVKIVERYSHSRSVPYVPPGRDATVSWYGPDFSFENAYNQPILIRAKAVKGTMQINIYSADSIQYQKRQVPNVNENTPKEVPAD